MPAQLKANDDCGTAVSLGTIPIGGTCPSGSAAITVNFTAETASGDAALPSCDNNAGTNLDAFYTFEAPSSGSVKLNVTSGSNLKMALYSGTCGSLVEEACYGVTNTGFQREFTGLTSGNTYILQVWTDDTDANTVDFCLEALCPAPSTLPSTNFSVSTIDFNWQENGTATEWDIEWGTQGFTLGSGTLLNGLTTTIQTLSGLVYFSSYDVYVRSNCGAGIGTSDWVGPFSFTVTYVGDQCSNFIDLATTSSPQTYAISNYLDDYAHCGHGSRKDIVACADLAVGERVTFRQTSTVSLAVSMRSGPCISGILETCTNSPFDDFEYESFVYDNHSASSKQVCFFVSPYSSSFNGDISLEWSIDPATSLAANGDCASPTAFGTPPVEGTCPGGIAIESVDFSTASITSGPNCYTSDVRDLYYSFTAPSTGSVRFHTSYPSQFINTDIRHGVALVDVCNGTESECITNYTSYQPYFDFTGLTTGNSYTIRYFLNMGTTNYSNISADICLEEICSPASNYTETNLAGTTADLNWDANDVVEWDLEWSNNQATLNNGGGTAVSGITSLPYTLNGIAGGVTYYYRVRPVCAGAGTSNWGTNENFLSTPIGENCDNYLDLATVTSPYTFAVNIYQYANDFSSCSYFSGEEDLVACVDLADGERLVISGQIPGGDYMRGSFEIGACGTGTSLACVSNIDNDQFYYDNRTGATEQVCYFAAQAPSEYGNVELTWAVSTAPSIPNNDECATPTAFGTLPAEGSCPSGLATETIDISAVPQSASTFSPSCQYYALHDVFYSFVAPSTGAAKLSMSNIVGGSYPQFGIAHFDVCSGTELGCQTINTSTPYAMVGLTPGDTYVVQYYFKQDYFNDEDPLLQVDICMEASCPPPSNVAIANITNTTADISWIANGASLWDIEYSPNSSFNTSTMITGVTSTPNAISGLSAGVNYYYRIRPDCGAISPSAWSQTANFSTKPEGDDCNTYIDLAVQTSPYTFTANLYLFADDFSSCSMSGKSDMVLCYDLADGDKLTIAGNLPGSDRIAATLEVGPCGTGVTSGCSTYNADNDEFNYSNYSGATKQICFMVSEEGNDYGNVVVTWTVETAPPFPSNDECVNAIDLGLIPDFGTCPGGIATDTIDFSALPLSPAAEAPSCVYYGVHDVFYTFEAPSTGAIKLDINHISSNASPYSTSFVFAAYDACSGTEISCGSATDYYDGFLSGLTEGDTYILQFSSASDYYGTAAHNYEAGFCLEAFCAPPAANSLTSTNHTTSSADLSWTGDTNGTWEIEWGARNFTAGTGTPVTGLIANSHTLSSLPSGSRLSYYLMLRTCYKSDKIKQIIFCFQGFRSTISSKYFAAKNKIIYKNALNGSA